MWAAHESPVEKPADATIGYEDFLKLQEQVAGKKEAAKKPKPSAGAANAKAAKALAAAAVGGPVKKVDKAPKKPVAAADANAKAEGSGKPQGEGDKVLRQMFDKRECRRMNAKPFAAAVQRWRNRRVHNGGYRAKNVKPRWGCIQAECS